MGAGEGGGISTRIGPGLIMNCELRIIILNVFLFVRRGVLTYMASIYADLLVYRAFNYLNLTSKYKFSFPVTCYQGFTFGGSA